MIQALQKYAVLKDVIDRCDRVIEEALRGNTLREAHIALESFNNGGKRLRPALVILSSMVPRGTDLEDVDPALTELAGAVELVHLATLFHDDVIDQVDTRRAKLSARLKYGNYASVLTGDFALAEALELVQRSGYSEAMPEFIRTLRVLIRGESIETANKFNYDLTEAEYYDIISEKSASLFALSCKVGALSQGPEFADSLGHFGWNLGMAFQMIDDLDDIVDSPNHSHDCDLRNGYIALPMIRAFDTLKDGHRERLIDIIDRGDFSPENERYIVSMCMEQGAIEATNVEIHRHLSRARDSLVRFNESRARSLLTNIVDDLAVYADRQVDNFSTYLRESTA
jgi:octaprenyl-diphosphate synthase